MSRIITRDSAGRQRTALVKGIALALREMSRQASIGTEARDLAAFIVLALREVAAGIDPSVAAWEKRGYWVKADRFRMEWAWSAPMASRWEKALTAEDWSAVADLAAQTAARLGNVQVSEHHRLGQPWKGAYARLMNEVQGRPAAA